MVSKNVLSGVLTCLLLTGTFPAFSQRSTPEAYVREDLLRAALVQHRYDPQDSIVTEAPKGYVPFYISHIGRHGSRAHNSSSSFERADQLAEFARRGLLTDEGAELSSLLSEIKAENERVGYGLLSSRGAADHRGIARRMANNYPEVFCNPQMPVVRCYSTSVNRVIVSMDSFAGQLSAMYPGLAIVKSTSVECPYGKTQTSGFSISAEEKEKSQAVSTRPFKDSILCAVDYSRLIRKTFSSGLVPEEICGKEAAFFSSLYLAGANRQSHDTPSLGWVEPYFTADEMVAFWKASNAGRCQDWTATTENGGIRVLATSSILSNIVADADAAIAGADTCATLRFSHDGIVLPLLCLMGVEGCDFKGSFRQANEHCCISREMPMAGNIQLVFYRNGAGDILVKLVHNDCETTIPSLPTEPHGPFYKWTDLKEWFKSRMEPWFATH